ncbi:unnamed protein product [Calicophoron daubneyi]|uniref:Uncharacterized protein n=1 Tax=Calicophoron daubneyi TaxID=300641 RepID=A0AAV2TFK1_CALDB
MPPPDPYTEIWKDFVLLQLEQADAVIVAPTPTLFQLYANESPSDTVIGKDFDYRDQKSEFLMDYLRGLYDYSPTADSSSKRLRRLLPPTVLALAGNDLDEAYKWSGFVYNLPFEIEPLMAATYGLIMAL